MGIETAIIGSALIGGGMSYLGSQKASKTAASAANNATATEYQMYLQSRQDLAPWRKQGTKALNQLSKMVQKGPGKFEESPSYQFAMDQGLEGVDRAMTGMGMGRSGAHLKAATEYAKNLASTEYDNFLRRYYQSLTPYQSLSNLGQTTGAQTGAAALQTGQQMGQNMIAAGNAQAAGQLGAYNTLANTAQWGAQQYLDYNQLNAMRNQTTGPTGGYYNMKDASPSGYNWAAYY